METFYVEDGKCMLVLVRDVGVPVDYGGLFLTVALMFLSIYLLMCPISLFAGLISRHVGLFSKLSLWSFKVMKACRSAMHLALSAMRRLVAMFLASLLMLWITVYIYIYIYIYIYLYLIRPGAGIILRFSSHFFRI